eukprot:TRINITY_DN1724_c0_g1_i2.p1 TRINITY_DN1724_c0_g1~~TRINITY_DN1724_c0_g1_i2.p1  ORF type:complete len:684 (-),score=155.42 TRINITY_DN1724_c0_g1_i2:48-1796(-)
MEKKYKKEIPRFYPLNCKTRDDFIRLYGNAEEIPHADFDYHSKVEPFERGLKSFNKKILITGRRIDQGNARINLPVWEEDKKTFNPLSNWTWNDVLQYVDKYNVPYNKAHHYFFRSNEDVKATIRHLPDLSWKKMDLGKPYWQLTETELYGNPPSKNVYVFKSFGDTHTSVPVLPHESERAGRFVRLVNTECGIHTRANHTGAPHGGVLVDLLVKDEEKKLDLIKSCKNNVIELNERQACDVELLINGGFSPLTGFLNSKDYKSVVKDMRLLEQQIWGVPITLDTEDKSFSKGDNVLLTYKGQKVAVLHVEERYLPDKYEEALNIFGTVSLDHPGVKDLFCTRGKYYLGGKISGLDIPKRVDGIEYKSPREVRKLLPAKKAVVAFQCRNPIHRAHYELLLLAQRSVPNSVILVHPTCGPTQPGDIDGLLRHKTYVKLEKETDSSFLWAYLPYSMVMAGPREAIQHMIVRKNFGATHFIIGRDMAGTKSTITGQDFYGPFDAQEFAKKHQKELGIEVVAAPELVYTAEKGYLPKDEAQTHGLKPLKLSGTEFRRKLIQGEEIPSWFAFPSVVEELRQQAAASK